MTDSVPSPNREQKRREKRRMERRNHSVVSRYPQSPSVRQEWHCSVCSNGKEHFRNCLPEAMDSEARTQMVIFWGLTFGLNSQPLVLNRRIYLSICLSVNLPTHLWMTWFRGWVTILNSDWSLGKICTEWSFAVSNWMSDEHMKIKIPKTRLILWIPIFQGSSNIIRDTFFYPFCSIKNSGV